MERSVPASLHGKRLLLAFFFFLLTLFGIGAERTTAQTLVCDSLGVGARANDDCCFNFILENDQNTFPIRQVSMTVSGGRIIASASGPQSATVSFGGNTATWSFPNGVPVRTDGLRACFAANGTAGGPFYVVFKWYVDSTRVLCSDTLELNCSEPKDSLCLALVEQEIRCNPEVAGPQNVWNWSFNLRNMSRFHARTYQLTVLSPQGVTVSPVSFQSQSGYGNGASFPRANVTITGGQPGQTVRILVRMCGSSTPMTDDVVCCEQVVEVTLPECPVTGRCLELVEQEIACDSAGYVWCFNVRNQANWTMGSLTLQSMQGAGIISPQTIQFNTPVQPGGLSERICVRIAGAKPGRLSVLAQNCADRLAVCCADSLVIELPECEPIGRDCCDGFIINFANATPVAAPNGLAGLIGLVGAGPNPISKVSATIVSASVNGQPAFAYFNSGTIMNPLGAGTVTPPPFGQELIWNSAAGVQMNGPSFFLNWLRLPSMAPNARRDTVSFCIRWRFTDVNCRTCDTLVCYRVVRNQFFFNTGRTAQNNDGKNATVLGGDGSVSGKLTGQNSSVLSIGFPELPAADFGNVTFTGITIQADENVRINNVASPFAGANFSAQHGIASGEFSATPGQQIDLNISYDNLNGRAALGHFLMISYESSLLPGVEQQIPLSVTLRQEGTAAGGDRIEAVRVDVDSREIVQTFALHLRNANNTQEALSGLRITAGDGVKLLAVGPTSSETEALLRFGAEGEGGRPYISEAAEGTVSLPSGAERNPIYITLAMNEEADPVIRYSTLNGLDETVSEGELNLAQISSVGDDRGGVTGTSISLGQSAPNPTTGQVAISMRLAAPERVSLTVRDLNGREVMRLLQDEQLTSGTHVVTADVSALPSGTYFYTLESASGTETRRMTVAK